MKVMKCVNEMIPETPQTPPPATHPSTILSSQIYLHLMRNLLHITTPAPSPALQMHLPRSIHRGVTAPTHGADALQRLTLLRSFLHRRREYVRASQASLILESHLHHSEEGEQGRKEKEVDACL